MPARSVQTPQSPHTAYPLQLTKVQQLRNCTVTQTCECQKIMGRKVNQQGGKKSHWYLQSLQHPGMWHPKQEHGTTNKRSHQNYLYLHLSMHCRPANSQNENMRLCTKLCCNQNCSRSNNRNNDSRNTKYTHRHALQINLLV